MTISAVMTKKSAQLPPRASTMNPLAPDTSVRPSVPTEASSAYWVPV